MKIERLKKKDIKEAMKVYRKGLQMEIPPGHPSEESVLNELKKNYVFVYKEKDKIRGIVSFEIRSNKKIRIDFICAITPGKGIGKKLMKRLADFSIRKGIKIIITAMSSKDERAMNFYKSCGFKKYGEYHSSDLFLYEIKVEPKVIREKLK